VITAIINNFINEFIENGEDPYQSEQKLTFFSDMLDPELPAEGRHIAKWRLRLNIPQEELLAIRGT